MKPLWKQIVEIGRKATAKRLPTSRERKAQASVNLYRRLKELQLWRHIERQGESTPAQRREIVQINERLKS